MQINVTGHQIDLTTSLQDYVHEKLQRLERHYDHITQVHVVLNIEKLNHQAEATVHVAGSELFANAEAADMYAAIDQLSAKLDRQVINHKENRRSQTAAESVNMRIPSSNSLNDIRQCR